MEWEWLQLLAQPMSFKQKALFQEFLFSLHNTQKYIWNLWICDLVNDYVTCEVTKDEFQYFITYIYIYI